MEWVGKVEKDFNGLHRSTEGNLTSCLVQLMRSLLNKDLLRLALGLNSQISLLLKNCQRSFYRIFLLGSPFFKATKQKTKRRNPAIWMHSMMPQTKQQKVFLFLCLIFVLEGFSNSSKRVPYRDIKPIKKRSGGWIGSLWSGNSTSGSTLARLEPRQRQNTCYSFCRTAFKWKK